MVAKDLLTRDGYLVLPGKQTAACRQFARLFADSAVPARLDLQGPLLQWIQDYLTPLAQTLLPAAFPVRALYFNKLPEKNWHVLWHQDRTIAVQERHSLPDWGPWSLKKGQPHVQPPASVLEKMLTLRLHLDEANDSNGCLHLVRQSHTLGFLDQEQIQQLNSQGHACPVAAGHVLAMKPLILHSSFSSQSTQPRRVVHIEFANEDLPKPLSWL